MILVIRILIHGLLSGLRSRSSLITENMALRHQLAVLQRSHMALGKSTPAGRVVESAESEKVIVLHRIGGLHHRYTPQAA